MAVDVTPSGQIQEFVDVLKRRRWQVILPTLFVLLLGTVFAVIVPKKFVITTVIELKEANLNAASDSRRLAESPVDREVEGLGNHLQNFARIKRVIEADVEQWPKYAEADNLQRNGMVEAIRKNLKVDNKPAKQGSTFIEISHKDMLAERGESFLAGLVKAAINDILTTAINQRKSEYDDLKETRDEIKVSSNRAVKYWRDLAMAEGLDITHAPGATGREARSRFDRLDENLAWVEKKLQDNLREKELSERRIDQYEEDLRAIPPTREVVAVSESIDLDELASKIQVGEQSLAVAQSALDAYRPGNSEYRIRLEHRDNLLERLARARENMVEVEPTKHEVDNQDYLELQSKIKIERDKYSLLLFTLEDFNSNLDAVRASKESLNVLLAQALTVYNESEAWRLQLVAAESELAEKEKTLRQTRQFTQEVIMDVATPAYASETAEDPNPYLIMGFCLFGGLALGLGITLLSEYSGNSYRTVSDLSSVMTVPVIGTIGSIVTRSEARRSMGLKLLVGVPSIVILAGISWMTWTWADEETRGTLPVEVIQVIDNIRVSLLSM